MEGEADQVPDQEPGDLVFTLAQKDHDIFRRQGNDLHTELEVTLAEALCGFSRVIIKHLDGRGLRLQYPRPEDPRVLSSGQFIKIQGEGMPVKKSDAKGVLYLEVHVQMPDHKFLEKIKAFDTLKKILPGPEEPLDAEEVDDVDYREVSVDEALRNSAHDEGGWEDEGDENDEGMEGTQCQQQ